MQIEIVFFRTFEMLLMSMTNCSQCFQADLLRVSRLFAVVATKRWSFFYRCVFFFQLNAISSGKRQRFHVPFEMLCVISFLDCGNKIRRLVQRFQVP